MKVVPATKTSKAKVFLDDRDLDQSDENGTQVVKSVVISPSSMLIMIDARFDTEVIQGVAYSAGSVKTQIILNRVTGILKKVEDIQGGILGATLGSGVHSSEELCRQK